MHVRSKSNRNYLCNYVGDDMGEANWLEIEDPLVSLFLREKHIIYGVEPMKVCCVEVAKYETTLMISPLIMSQHLLKKLSMNPSGPEAFSLGIWLMASRTTPMTQSASMSQVLHLQAELIPMEVSRSRGFLFPYPHRSNDGLFPLCSWLVTHT